MNALIVDDEGLARKELRFLLQGIEDVEIVAEAEDVQSAVRAVHEHAPDLVFLDIEMPGGSGLDVLDKLEAPVPDVIFTTAYDRYAVDAFKVGAVDYLLKPIEADRLNEAVQRVRERREEAGEGEGGSSAPYRPSGEDYLRPEDKVFVREDSNCWFIPVRSIRLLESEGNYTRVYFDKEKPLILRSLKAMEDRLDPKNFFRANRRQIINLEWVEEMDPGANHNLTVQMKGGMEVEMSRRQALVFREKMSL